MWLHVRRVSSRQTASKDGHPCWLVKARVAVHERHFLTPVEREGYRLHLRDGRLFDAKGKLFDTTKSTTAHGGDGRAIFVMDDQCRLYASKVHAVGEFHHSSLLSGQPVAAAGETQVEKGMVKLISDKSGHYRPTAEHTRQLVDVLVAGGVDMKSVAKDLIHKLVVAP
jgi:hypothetical protein